MQKVIATLTVAFSLLVLPVPPALAAPTEVGVRIEGKNETIFEGSVLAEPHAVKASSDKARKLRRCDGINVNDPGNVTPGLTPTAVAADAMTLIGESFDGQWYVQYEDYFVTRWGPDLQNPGTGAYWGILVNDVFTNVGGCQYQLDDGDEVLWVYDAFRGRPNLALLPEEAAYTAGPRPATATAQLNVPFPVEVVSYEDDEESVPPPAPGLAGSGPYQGAEVAPVLTSAQGFEKVNTADPATVTTNSQGKASVTFSTPGWHRIKATVAGAGGESAIRSNRLDVCVPPGGPPLEGAGSCAELPRADQVRVPPPTVGEIESPHHDEPPSPARDLSGGGSGSSTPSQVHITVPRLDRRDIAQGRVGVSWRVLSPGVGIGLWRISSETLGRRGARYLSRATGTGATSATLRLPPGKAYRLRFTITDVLGRSSAVALGKVVVPDAHRP